jgi:hypothetical protein
MTEPTLASSRINIDFGFSFQPILEYGTEIWDRGAMLDDLRKHGSGTIVIGLFRMKRSDDALGQEKRLDEFLTGYLRSQNGVYVKGPVSPITVGGHDGVAIETTGLFRRRPFQGRAVLAPQSESEDMVGLCFGLTKANENRWANEGREACDTVLSSVTFSVRK